jgi:beta-N-acetylglucosaminidase
MYLLNSLYLLGHALLELAPLLAKLAIALERRLEQDIVLRGAHLAGSSL